MRSGLSIRLGRIEARLPAEGTPVTELSDAQLLPLVEASERWWVYQTVARLQEDIVVAEREVTRLMAPLPPLVEPGAARPLDDIDQMMLAGLEFGADEFPEWLALLAKVQAWQRADILAATKTSLSES